MTEISIPWDGTDNGDSGQYFHTDWVDMLRNRVEGANNALGYGAILAGTGDGDSPPLSVYATSPATTQVRITPGSALVNGYFYRNTSEVLLTVPAEASNTYGLVVLRADYNEQEVRVAYKIGTAAAYPALSQNDSMYEIPLAKVRASSSFTEIEGNDLIPFRYPILNAYEGVRRGFSFSVSGSEVTVSPGEIEVNGERVSIESRVTLDVDTDANWLNEDKPVLTDIFVHVYINAVGEIKLGRFWPYFTRPFYDDAVGFFTVTAGGTLGSTSLTVTENTTQFRTSFNTAGVERGDFAFVFEDFDDLDGAPRGSAANPSGEQNWSIAYVDGYSAGTLTLLDGHNIDIDNSDRVLVVKNRGDICYLPATRDFMPLSFVGSLPDLDGSTWWKYLGSVFSTSSGGTLGYSDRFIAERLTSDGSIAGSSSWTRIPNVATHCIWNEHDRPLLNVQGSIQEAAVGIDRMAIGYHIGGIRMGINSANDDGLWYLNPTTTNREYTFNALVPLRKLDFYDKLPPGTWMLEWYHQEDGLGSVTLEGNPTVGEVRFTVTVNNYHEHQYRS